MTDDVYSDEKRDELRKDDAKGREVGMEYAEKFGLIYRFQEDLDWPLLHLFLWSPRLAMAKQS